MKKFNPFCKKAKATSGAIETSCKGQSKICRKDPLQSRPSECSDTLHGDVQNVERDVYISKEFFLRVIGEIREENKKQREDSEKENELLRNELRATKQHLKTELSSFFARSKESFEDSKNTMIKTGQQLMELTSVVSNIRAQQDSALRQISNIDKEKELLREECWAKMQLFKTEISAFFTRSKESFKNSYKIMCETGQQVEQLTTAVEEIRAQQVLALRKISDLEKKHTQFGDDFQKQNALLGEELRATKQTLEEKVSLFSTDFMESLKHSPVQKMMEDGLIAAVGQIEKQRDLALYEMNKVLSEARSVAFQCTRGSVDVKAEDAAILPSANKCLEGDCMPLEEGLLDSKQDDVPCKESDEPSLPHNVSPAPSNASLSNNPRPLKLIDGAASDKKGELISVDYMRKNLLPEKTIGRGGFGSVRLVRDKVKDKLLVVKHIREGPDNLKADIENEIAVLKALSGNKFFPKLTGHLFTDDEPPDYYIFMNYVANSQDLHQFATENGAQLTPEVISFILYQVVQGLNHMHSIKILHRDIKPHNILINRRNTKIKIIDFGLSMFGQQGTGFVGTLGYVAPEMGRLELQEMEKSPDWHIQGSVEISNTGQLVTVNDKQIVHSYGPAADFYSFGAVAYYLYFRTSPAEFFYERHPDLLEFPIWKYLCVPILMPHELKDELATSFLKRVLQEDPRLRLYGKRVLVDPYFKTKKYLGKYMKQGLPLDKSPK